MNQKNEVNVGFDARILSRINVTYLPIERLRSHTAIVMSVDHATWPSLFDADLLSRLGWIGPRQYLWEDLTVLEEHIGKLQIDMKITVIGVTQFISSDELNQQRFNYRTNPATIPSDWKFLGYDVADFYLLSSLSNISYSGEELTVLRRDFGPDLSQYHLFDSFDYAEKFRRFSDENVIEHSPFFVYGIYSKSQIHYL